MIWDGYGERGVGEPFLHHNMASTLAHFDKIVTHKNGANLLSG